jgi:hypothetical protein
MPNTPQLLPCDGCGQLADSAHISRRLQRLEWATRFRPIHIQSLLVSGISPRSDDEFLYNPQGRFVGEARNVLTAVAVSIRERTAESVLTDFQKRGLMLIHVLECPLSSDSSQFEARPILEHQLAATVTRIRRSLKPKRVLLVSADLAPLADKLHQSELGCPVFPSTNDPFLASLAPTDAELQAFESALVSSHVQTA